jgi:Flp pilus assembly protein TadD
LEPLPPFVHNTRAVAVAISKLETAVAQHPDDAKAHYALGELLTNIRDREADGAAHIQTAVALDADLQRHPVHAKIDYQ